MKATESEKDAKSGAKATAAAILKKMKHIWRVKDL